MVGFPGLALGLTFVDVHSYLLQFLHQNWWDWSAGNEAALEVSECPL